MALRLDLSTSVSRSLIRTDQNFTVSGGRSLIVGSIDFPTGKLSGSGQYSCYVTYELPALHRAIIQRKTTRDASGAITADTLECRMSPNGADPTPESFAWYGQPGSELPPAVYLKLGWVDDENVIYQVAAADQVFLEVTRRVTSGFTFATPGALEVGFARLSGDIVPTTLTVGRISGGTDPYPSTANAAKSSTALSFPAGGAVRVFPTYTGDIGTFLIVGRAADVARALVPIGQSQGTQATLLDMFDRVDGALGANWSAAGGTAPTISGNQVVGSTGGTTTAIWTGTTPGVDAEAFVTIKAKPAAPPATVFNALRVVVRAAGSGATLQAYILSLSHNTNGTHTFYIQRISNGSPGGTPVNVGSSLTVNVNDSIGIRIVGTTLQAFHRPAGGSWAQVGANVTDTSLATGGSIGFQLAVVNGQAWTVDDFGGGVATTLTAPFPASASGQAEGRHMRINAHSGTNPDQLAYVNATIPGEASGGLIPYPRDWVIAAVCRDPTTSSVSVRVYDPAAGTFAHATNVATLSAGTFTQTGAARFCLGASQPAASTATGFEGDLAAAAFGTAALTASEFEALIVSPGMITRSALSAFREVVSAYDLTMLASPTDQILDLVGARDEITGERIGTNTISSDPDNVPIGVGSEPPPPPPPFGVPDAPPVTITGATVDPAAPTTGKFHIAVAVTVADASIEYVPHASPYRFGWAATPSAAASEWTWTAWQAGNEADITGQPLSTEQTPAIRYWSAQYRDDSGVTGDQGTPVMVEILSLAEDIDAVVFDPTYINRANGGLMTIYWEPNPPEDGVTEYDVFVVPAGGPIDLGAPFYAGPGTLVVGGAHDGDITCPQVTGLDDAAEYNVAIRAHRTIA